MGDIWEDMEIHYAHSDTHERRALSEWFRDALDRYPGNMEAASTYIEGRVWRGELKACAPSGRIVEIASSGEDYFTAGDRDPSHHVLTTCTHRHGTIREADDCEAGKKFARLWNFAKNPIQRPG